MADERIVEGYTLGVFASNCYIAAARAGDAAVVIDSGEGAGEVIKERLAAHGLRLEALLLTHGHIDHIWGAADVADAAGVPAYIHPDDRYMLDDPGAALGRMGMGKMQIATPADVRDLADGDRFRFGDLEIEVRHTPGHTPGHCVFVTNGILFSGDLIFQGSIGRTDFPGGDLDQLLSGIRAKLWPLTDETAVYPGHGPPTTVGVEKRTNPFLAAGARFG